MIVTLKDKEIIARKVRQRKAHFVMSLDAVGAKVGVNKSTVNKLVHESDRWKTESVSDEMWIKFADWTEYDFNDGSWKVFRNAINFRNYYNICKHVKDDSIMRIISDRFGKGKSTALKAFQRDHVTSAWYFICDRSMTQKVLVRSVKKQLGLSANVTNIYSALDDISAHIERIKHTRPVLLFDEYNRLSEGSKSLIKTIYDRTEGNVGIVICGGENLEVDLNRGINRAKLDYQETYDRAGAVYRQARAMTIEEITTDITTICKINGVTDKLTIQAIINNFSGSFRKVKADIDDYKKKLRKGGSQ